MPEITPEKLAALREALDRDKRVEFKNRSIVRRRSKDEGIIVQRRTGGGRRHYVEYSLGTHSYEAAYELALNGPEPRPQLPREPFWFDPRKRRKLRPEWDEVPF